LAFEIKLANKNRKSKSSFKTFAIFLFLFEWIFRPPGHCKENWNVIKKLDNTTISLFSYEMHFDRE
jgi:hypothetical protein